MIIWWCKLGKIALGLIIETGLSRTRAFTSRPYQASIDNFSKHKALLQEAFSIREHDFPRSSAATTKRPPEEWYRDVHLMASKGWDDLIYDSSSLRSWTVSAAQPGPEKNGIICYHCYCNTFSSSRREIWIQWMVKGGRATKGRRIDVRLECERRFFMFIICHGKFVIGIRNE